MVRSFQFQKLFLKTRGVSKMSKIILHKACKFDTNSESHLVATQMGVPYGVKGTQLITQHPVSKGDLPCMYTFIYQVDLLRFHIKND